MQIETVPIDSLQEHPRNYRAHPNEQVVEIAHSLNQFGQYKPVVISSDGVILAGHGVVRGVKASGSETVEVHRMEFTADDPRAEKLIVADNELSRMAQDDDAALAALLSEVAEKDSLAGTGFDEDGLAALLKEVSAQNAPPPVEDPGPVEPPIEPVTKLGDVWLMGDHRLVCGDCTDAGAWEKATQGAICSLLLADPPYNVDLSGYGEHFDDDRAADEYAAWTRDWFTIAQAWTERQIVTPGAANEPLWCRMVDPHHIAPWTKTNAMTNGKVSRFWCWEPIVFVGDKWRRDRANDVFDYPVSNQADVGGHPCPKPLGLWVDILQNYSEAGATVADCFCGSGSIIMAGEQTKRIACAIELAPQWCDVSIKRWMKATGRVATLEATGAPFPAGE